MIVSTNRRGFNNTFSRLEYLLKLVILDTYNTYYTML